MTHVEGSDGLCVDPKCRAHREQIRERAENARLLEQARRVAVELEAEVNVLRRLLGAR